MRTIVVFLVLLTQLGIEGAYADEEHYIRYGDDPLFLAGAQNHATVPMIYLDVGECVVEIHYVQGVAEETYIEPGHGRFAKLHVEAEVLGGPAWVTLDEIEKSARAICWPESKGGP